MFRTSVGRWLRAAGATALIAAMMPVTGVGAADASQQGQDHKVTICHRTNSENNPYVVITIDKAAIFKRGHDTHDEGGVHQPGDKANGVRWGDIIPPFDYYATPSSTETSHYDGLNYTAEGQAVLANGCEVPGEGEQPEPTGSFSLPCVDTGDPVVISSDDIDSDGAPDVSYQLVVVTGGSTSTLAVTESQLEADSGYVVQGAQVGSTITLQAKIGDGQWTTLDGPKIVEACPTPPAPAGQFTAECTPTAARADVGTVTNADGGTLALVATGFSQTVSSGQQDVAVPASTTLRLEHTKGGETRVLDTETSPAACPTANPSGGLQTSKTVSPTGTVEFGDTLTYSIAVSATGADQTQVVVTDYIPGHKPGETSGTTTYVAGSAACTGSGTCTASYDAAAHLVTWNLGTLAAGTSRTVTFQVTVDTPPADDDGAVPAVTIRNSGAVRSAETLETPTNVVVNDLVAVQGTKHSARPGSGASDTGVEGTKSGPGRAQLAHTGPATTWWILVLGLGMLFAGIALVTGGRIPAARALRR
jgi:uncharacterized repeat protein (TIGR01451 family)